MYKLSKLNNRNRTRCTHKQWPKGREVDYASQILRRGKAGGLWREQALRQEGGVEENSLKGEDTFSMTMVGTKHLMRPGGDDDAAVQ